MYGFVLPWFCADADAGQHAGQRIPTGAAALEVRPMKCSLLLLIVAVTPLSAAHAGDCAHATTQAAMNRLKGDKDGTQVLVTAQKRWLAFREAECTRSTSASAQGSIHSMLLSQCRADLTRKRIEELKAYICHKAVRIPAFQART